MKKILLISTLAAIMVSCAPTQGVKPTLYKGGSAEILATIGQIGPTIQPNRTTNYFSVVGITPTTVTMKATPTTGFQVLNALAGSRTDDGSITLTFTALESAGTTSVTHYSNHMQSVPEYAAKVYAELDKRFPRIPN